MTNLAHGAVAIVGQRLHDDRHAAGPVALEGDLFVAHAFQFAGAALDGPLDVVLRHVFGLGRGNGGAQPGVAVRVAAALGSDGDFLEQTGEYLAALGIQRALFVLDCGPFRMAGHGNLNRRENAGAEPRRPCEYITAKVRQIWGIGLTPEGGYSGFPGPLCCHRPDGLAKIGD